MVLLSCVMQCSYSALTFCGRGKLVCPHYFRRSEFWVLLTMKLVFENIRSNGVDVEGMQSTCLAALGGGPRFFSNSSVTPHQLEESQSTEESPTDDLTHRLSGGSPSVNTTLVLFYFCFFSQHSPFYLSVHYSRPHKLSVSLWVC